MRITQQQRCTLNAITETVDYSRSKKSLSEYKGGSIDVASQLSLPGLEADKPQTAAFLRLCGFFDNEDVCREYLYVTYKFDGNQIPKAGVSLYLDGSPTIPFPDLDLNWLDKICFDEATFDATVKALYEFPFARWNEGSDGFSIHSFIYE